ncbi:aminotransferase class I/II-fold pyridoxal phosphate-dependent enzyme [Streptomyces sp. HNM0575]|uniref:aminotransferase class I/II-fold pyridoxal phosphate-dependent enzyme n=1 Tax=Streptomyces sp. HNM0575 TaxID=2716338 RepID=UPI001F0E556F|nr:aminotransferase class I/II-fold pyridoxal phosphate-dependent enzyme [Streptomyces sp. HNM0575]
MQPVIGSAPVLHQMSLNETFFPPSPGVLRAVHEAAADSHRTNDALATGLTGRIAERLGVPAADVLVGPGSAALLQQLFSALTGPGAAGAAGPAGSADSTGSAGSAGSPGSAAGAGSATVHAWPSWEAYPMLAANAGSATVRVPLRDDDSHDLDAMADAVTDQTRMVVLCHPNNPTGTALRHSDAERFLARLPSHVTVVVDEAYRDFVRDDFAADGITLYRDDERVCVVRTFSKSYGLLGLRVGYVVGHPRTLGPLRGLQPFIRVSNTAQAAAQAALAEEKEFRRRCEVTVGERERLYGRLLELGWEVRPSQANFLWLPMTEGVEHFTQFCADHGVLVCGKPGEGVRVTVAEREANDAFAELAGKFGGERPHDEGGSGGDRTSGGTHGTDGDGGDVP